MKEEQSYQIQNQTLRRIVVFLLVLGATAVTIGATRWIFSLRDPAKLAAFQTTIVELGWVGWLVLLAIQYVQIVIAFIPGGPIQIIAGALYGPWTGLVICLLGTILASATVFFLMSRFGSSLANRLVGPKELARYDFLTNSSKLEWGVFLLFLIPGTPKDALTYAFAMTPIKMGRFMVNSTLARIPAMAISLFAGQTIIQKQWGRALVMFLVLGGFSLVGMLVHKKIMAWLMLRREGES